VGGIRETLSQKQAGCMVHSCNPSYRGGRDRRPRPAGKKIMRLYLKNKLKAKWFGDIVEAVELA
jgi:hypothetical protein